VAALAVILCLLAAGAGYLAGHGGSADASLGPTRVLSAGGVSVRVPTAWVSRGDSVPELFRGVLASAGPASAPSAAVSVGLTRGFGPSMVPQTLRSAVGAVPALGPAVRTAGGAQGRIYRFRSSPRRYEILFVPTTHLVATVACVAPVRGADAAVLAVCDRVLESLSADHALALDPRPTYASFLRSTLGTLAARAAAELRVYANARDPLAQARAAAALASAFDAAQTAFTGLIGHGLSAPELGLQIALRNKLAEIGDRYRELAVAARRGDGIAYAKGQSQLGIAIQDLSARLYELTRGGYTLS